ncbi:hypothetical protein E2562_023434 [Oryza meyeriana var. granulata]|uniref:Uncharacterized protein n=1 Tax=Oryza meyeriana var. granulata TaxID=110450 RepID=A0A6G1FBC0_9ORYZ|nr:hypothetical protein E2562_023434 [Oryza meyeriana var. granulata]
MAQMHGRQGRVARLRCWAARIGLAPDRLEPCFVFYEVLVTPVAAREEEKGKIIVTMFSSGGERYLNSELFAQVEECISINNTF